MKNITINDDGTSRWSELHGEEFKGDVFLFGCLVYYIPPPTVEDRASHSSRMKAGIFLGYEILSGFRWDKIYNVVDLDQFVHNGKIKNLHHEAPYTSFSFEPVRTRKIKFGSKGVHFPLKAEYDRCNCTVESLAEAEVHQPQDAIADAQQSIDGSEGPKTLPIPDHAGDQRVSSGEYLLDVPPLLD